MKSSSVRFGVVAAVVISSLAAGSFVAQEVMSVAQEAPGVRTSSSMANFSRGESVDDFSGGLTVVHPSAVSLPQHMGGTLCPVRVYNSKCADDPYNEGFAGDYIDKLNGPLGMGWHLGFGRVMLRLSLHEVYGSPGTYETRVHYFYVDESDAEHKLYAGAMQNWAGANVEPEEGWYFTNDGSFLRARYSRTSHQWTLYYPDGTKREAGGTENQSFVRPVQGAGPYLQNPRAHGWYVVTMKDRSGTATTISCTLRISLTHFRQVTPRATRLLVTVR